jgi:uncharacterized protein YecT (DUF1311 family)
MMMKTNVLLSLIICALIGLNAPLFAQQEQPNFEHIYQIDNDAQACLKKKSGQVLVQIECELERYKKWTQALDEVYDYLSKSVSKQEKEVLALQQEAWVDFRERKLEFDNLFYNETQMLQASRSKADFVRTRVLELLHYVEIRDERSKQTNIAER